ncbi:hypothetical protein MSPP1_001576 [Malassezia sp. CBS 17886]|nr:hypothetical protein MSPP1_001576 [Malassezia sp. CBS 17886]
MSDDQNMDLPHATGVPGGDVAVDGDARRRTLYSLPDPERPDDQDDDEEAMNDTPSREVSEPGTRPPSPPLDSRDSVRLVALHLEGGPISQLSTSRLMAYVASAAAQAKGIEWIDDARCVIVFSSYQQARNGLQKICLDVDALEAASLPSPEQMSALEGGAALTPSVQKELLTPRVAMAFPSTLYNVMEQHAAEELPAAMARLEDARSKLNEGTEPVPEIYRDMELEELERNVLTPEQTRYKKIRQSLWIRFALHEYDTKAPRAANRSNWYRQHGRSAGKDVVPRLLGVGASYDGARRGQSRGELFARDTGHRECRRYDDLPYGEDPYTRPRASAFMDSLPDDRRYGHDWSEDRSSYAPSSLLDRIGRSAGDRGAHDALRSRSASPDDAGELGPGEVRIRGRGAVHAPRSRMAGWDDDGGPPPGEAQ